MLSDFVFKKIIFCLRGPVRSVYLSLFCHVYLAPEESMLNECMYILNIVLYNLVIARPWIDEGT